jgi:hypothetical protein
MVPALREATFREATYGAVPDWLGGDLPGCGVVPFGVRRRNVTFERMERQSGTNCRIGLYCFGPNRGPGLLNRAEASVRINSWDVPRVLTPLKSGSAHGFPPEERDKHAQFYDAVVICTRAGNINGRTPPIANSDMSFAFRVRSVKCSLRFLLTTRGVILLYWW